MIIQRTGATTPSEKFSARLSIAARATPASSSALVSRLTMCDTASRPLARPAVSSASATRATEQAERKKQKSALNNESRHADNANEQNNGDSSERASQRGSRRFAVPSALEYRDQAAHPDHGMTN